jgi:hypothetical protein
MTARVPAVPGADAAPERLRGAFDSITKPSTLRAWSGASGSRSIR